jgi:hypothetical protein
MFSQDACSLRASREKPVQIAWTGKNTDVRVAKDKQQQTVMRLWSDLTH